MEHTVSHFETSKLYLFDTKTIETIGELFFHYLNKPKILVHTVTLPRQGDSSYLGYLHNSPKLLMCFLNCWKVVPKLLPYELSFDPSTTNTTQ